MRRNAAAVLESVTTALWFAFRLTLASADTKDSTGLVGTSPALLLDTARLPLQFWANPRKSALKPRKRDLHEPTLMALLGSDYDATRMKRSKASTTSSDPETRDEEERAAVRALKRLSAGHGEPTLQLPARLPPEYRKAVEEWLVSRAACHVAFVWDDLGPYFWPRWIRRGECSSGNSSCSWPPGMSCRPGAVTNLHVLRWHCRLRKHQRAGKKDATERKRQGQLTAAATGMSRLKKRRKYRCFWIKVPYPVPEDCICACADTEEDGEKTDQDR